MLLYFLKVRILWSFLKKSFTTIYPLIIFVLNKNPQYYEAYHFKSSLNESKSFILLP